MRARRYVNARGTHRFTAPCPSLGRKASHQAALLATATTDPAILPDKGHLVTSLPRPGGDHKFTAASMVSRRAAQTFAHLACGTGVHYIRTVPARGPYASQDFAALPGVCAVSAGCGHRRVH
jgi:hypothetical protein